MLELLVATLIQVTVLTSGSAPVKTTTATTSTTTTVRTSAAAPTSTTSIGTSGWDDRN
ncbi:hypothetical protein HUW51_06995 [Adhaeribacter swui]|uniref:Uncharacterized protein n=1 Tax=Adhaeribacter swui TaxID=2086471 RepID=A0A7G7G5Q3_9BACT|nr:hypothetical protein [Adhaeribacter swui]QNF32487.1 hypothetical protein HUW51_06995 [Adhaeribacter swui]